MTVLLSQTSVYIFSRICPFPRMVRRWADMHISLYGDGTASPKNTPDPKSDTIEPRVRLYFTLYSAMTQTTQIIYATPSSDEPSEMIHARYAVLAAMPLPPDAPADTLKPIVIPAPFTFNEFINSITSVSARISYAFGDCPILFL
jgi:hypothetical protein